MEFIHLYCFLSRQRLLIGKTFLDGFDAGINALSNAGLMVPCLEGWNNAWTMSIECHILCVCMRM